MTALPDIKLRTVAQLPASIASGVGVNVEKANGRWQFELDYTNIQVKDSIPSSEYADSKQLFWNATSGVYTLVPYSVPSPKVVGTSTTSADIATGTANFTVEAGIGWTVGLRLRGSNQSDETQYVEGLITAYDPVTGALTLDVDNIGGTGTVTAWNFGVAGDKGTAGASPPTSVYDTVAAAQASSLASAPASIQTRGKASAGDYGGAIYKNNGTTSGDLVITLSDGTTVVGFTLAEAILRPDMFGAVGDGTTDDTTALQALQTASVAGQVIDYGARAYLVSAQIKTKAGTTHRNGKFVWTMTTALYGALVAADKTRFDNLEFVGSGTTGSGVTSLYQVGIFSGATSTAGRAPASHVKVTNCRFSNMTVGVWINPDSGDTTPDDWIISGCTFDNIVGLAGLSEGYGVVAGLATRINVVNNSFNTIRRHAIYYTGILNGIIANNNILTIDNIAIQINTFSAQPPCTNLIIANNTISGFTRSIAYGYSSSVGIGAYGKTVGVNIVGNMIFGALDIGIDLIGISGDTTETGARAHICGNHIVMDSSAAAFGIEVSDYYDASVTANKIELQSVMSGIQIKNVSTSTSISGPIIVNGNAIFTTNASAIAIETFLAVAQVVLVHNNSVYGFTPAKRWNDDSTGGTPRSDFNGGYGAITVDADATYFAGGFGAKNAGFVNFNGTLTAARNFTLDKTFIPSWVKSVRISNASSANFALNVKNGSGGSTLKSVGQNTWAEFAVTQTPDWAYVSSGSL